MSDELIQELEQEIADADARIDELDASISKFEDRIKGLKMLKERKEVVKRTNKKRISALYKPYRVLIYTGQKNDIVMTFKTRKGMLKKFDEYDRYDYGNDTPVQVKAYKFIDNKKGQDTGQIERLNTFIGDYYLEECRKENVRAHLRNYTVFFYGISGLAKNVRQLPDGIERYITFITSDASDYLKNAGRVPNTYQVAKLFLKYHNLDYSMNRLFVEDFVEMVRRLDRNLGQREVMISKGMFLNHYMVVKIDNVLRFRKL